MTPVAHGTYSTKPRGGGVHMLALAEARAAMIEAHHVLAEAKLRIGVRTKMDGFPKPIQNVEAPAEERRTA